MICLDSGCIIDFLNGDESAKEVILEHRDEIVTTEINVFEIFLGIYQQKEVSVREEASAESFFNEIPILSYGKECGKNSAKLLADLRKKGEVIEQNDCHIAAIMRVNGCDKIITKNVKHFSKIEDVEVVSY